MKTLYNDYIFLDLLFKSKFYHVAAEDYKSKINSDEFIFGVRLFEYILRNVESNKSDSAWKKWLYFSLKDILIYLAQKPRDTAQEVLVEARNLSYKIETLLFLQDMEWQDFLTQPIQSLTQLVQKSHYNPLGIKRGKLVFFEELKRYIEEYFSRRKSDNIESDRLAWEAFCSLAQLDRLAYDIEKDFLFREAVLQQALNNRTTSEFVYDYSLYSTYAIGQTLSEIYDASLKTITYTFRSATYLNETFNKSIYFFSNLKTVMNQLGSFLKKYPLKTIYTLLAIASAQLILHSVNYLAIKSLREKSIQIPFYKTLSQFYLTYLTLGSFIQMISLPVSTPTNADTETIRDQQTHTREEHIRLSAEQAREKAAKSFDDLVASKKHQDNTNNDYEIYFNQNAESYQPHFTRTQREYFLGRQEYSKNSLSIFWHGFGCLEKFYPEKKWDDIIKLSSGLRPQATGTQNASASFLRTYGALSSRSLSQQTSDPKQQLDFKK